MFIVQGTLNAYNGNNEVPDSAWRNLFSSRSMKVAFANLEKRYAAMRCRCSPRSWDSNYRIITTKDVEITTGYYCSGPITKGSDRFCGKTTEKKWIWKADTEWPGDPGPDDWPSSCQCPECNGIDQGEINKWSQQ